MVYYKSYSICLACILAVIFTGSFFCGLFIKEYGYTVPEMQNTEYEKAESPKKTTETKEVFYEIDYYYDIPLSNADQDYVFELCDKYSVSPELVFSIMEAGSEYAKWEISESGDWGIMQINELNHDWLKESLSIEEIFSYENNVLCGIYILSDYCKKYPDISSIAMCYRYGETKALEMREMGIYETPYTRKIIEAFRTLNFR